MSSLSVEDVTVRFGGVVALDAVSLSAPDATVTGLIGPNGAGKTTLFNVITGLQASSAGAVRLGGEDISSLKAHHRARRGLARTFQRLEMFGSLSVRDNLLVAAESRGVVSPRAVVDDILARLGLRSLADTRANALPTGTSRLVELGRALATAPTVLLLDEPASGLDDHETEHFGQLLVELAADGLAILLVEHDVDLVMQVCSTVHVLDFGVRIASGGPAEVREDPGVQAAYLGEEVVA
ncbi:MAG: branched-chain amino acid transport system ATP-binding protein [Acidimicrobiaceae bacterium]